MFFLFYFLRIKGGYSHSPSKIGGKRCEKNLHKEKDEFIIFTPLTSKNSKKSCGSEPSLSLSEKYYLFPKENKPVYMLNFSIP